MYYADLDLEDLPANELQYGAVCDLIGKRRDFSSLHGRIYTADFRYLDEVAADEGPDGVDPDLVPLLVKLLRLLILFRYRGSGRFTQVQLRTVYLVWVLEMSLRDIAALEKKKSPETIRQRIVGTKGYGGLSKKAPEFWHWWVMNRMK